VSTAGGSWAVLGIILARAHDKRLIFVN